jgi:hypothetical protein
MGWSLGAGDRLADRASPGPKITSKSRTSKLAGAWWSLIVSRSSTYPCELPDRCNEIDAHTRRALPSCTAGWRL